MTLFPFNKVVKVNHYYKNQFGQERTILPTAPTFLGVSIDPQFLEARRSRGDIDTWLPVVRFYLGWRTVEYSGVKAQEMYDSYRKWLFRKGK